MATSKFGAAYKAARDKGEKEFTFNGKKYTTESREEKADRMATNQRQKMAGSAAGAGRGSSAGRGAGDKQETTSFSPRSVMGMGAMARGAEPKARPSLAEQQDAATAKQERIKKQDAEVSSPARKFAAKMRAAGEGRPTDIPDEMYKKGGKVAKGMHRMPDGSMMKDSEHKKPKKKMGGGMMKYRGGGCVTKKMKPTKYV